MRPTIEALLICHIINEQYTHRTAIVSRRDGSETFLARRIPNLQLDTLAVQLDRPDLEIDADGRDEGRGERVFAEAQ